MVNRSIFHFTIIAVVLMLLVSCSSQNQSDTDPVSVDPVIHQTAAESQAGHTLWGYWNLLIDPEAENLSDIEIVPVREADLHFNIIRLLEQAPCNTCFQVVGFSNNGDGTFDLEIRITHPFTELELTAFDCRGIIMFDGTKVISDSGDTISLMSMYGGELLNAEGYTRLYNYLTEGQGPGGLEGYIKGKLASPYAPNATINGYIRHFTPPENTNPRNALLTSSSVTKTYTMAFPTPHQFVIGYAIDVSWAVPDTIPVTNPMTDFPPDANSLEAWKIELAYEDIDDGITDQGGQGKLVIDIYDHQGPDTINSVEVESLDLMIDPASGSWIADFPGYSRYEAVIENELLAGEGEYLCLISVEDVANDSEKPWLDLTAYQLYTVTVAEFIPQAEPPVAIAEADPVVQIESEQIHFYDNGSFDPDGTIVLYEWDWDNDGTFDESSADTYHSWDTAETYYVQFRVTDNDDSTDVLDTPIEITIIEDANLPPVAMAAADPQPQTVCEPVHFYDDGSFDEEEIVKYEWDWNNDGTYDEEGADLYHTWNELGTYPVQFRVTDIGGLTDELDEALQIEIINALPTAMAAADDYTPFVGDIVLFDGSGSHDNDCGEMEITMYEWDFDGDGSYDSSGTSDSASHKYLAVGTYNVMLRVTDDEGDTSTLSSPLMIVVTEEIDCLDLGMSWGSTYGKATSQSMNVIKDQATWESWWEATANAPANPPAVNWDTEMVIAIAMGTCNTSGFFPTVDSACFDDDDELEIVVGWHKPGFGCMVLMVITHPWTAIRVDRYDNPYYFNDYIDVYTCD